MILNPDNWTLSVPVVLGRHRRPGLSSSHIAAPHMPRHRAGTHVPRHRADVAVDSSPVTAWPKHRAAHR